jgi:ELWxxDGT repeat protein
MKTSRFLGLPSFRHVNTLSLHSMKNHPPILRPICLGLLMTLTASGQTVQVLSDINTAPLSASAIADELVVAGNSLFIATDDAVSGSELWKFDVKAAFQSPRAVAADTDGTLYVADTANHVIRKISPNGTVTTLAGKVGVAGELDAAGVSATFSSPQGIAVVTSGTSKGVVYVADTGNHTIRRITPEGVVTTPAGDGGSPGSVDGAGGSARFRNPRGVAVNSTGTTVYVADTGNHTIRSIAISGTTTISATVSAVAGTALSPGDVDATGTGARFRDPSAIALDNQERLYVADAGNHKLRRIVSGVVTTLAGNGTAGNANGSGTAARFSSPQGVTSDSSGTNIYVGDTGNHLLRRVTSAGAVTTLAGTGAAGAADGAGALASFNGLQGLILQSGSIYVADTTNHTIRRATTAGLTSLYAGQTGISGGIDGAALSTSTSSAPELVRDIFPGPTSSEPKNLTSVGSNLFFSAEDANGDRDLWISDGTVTGTKRVGTTNFFDDPNGPENLLNVNGTLFFEGFSSAKGAELWKATVSGTTVTVQEVLDINAGIESSEISDLFNAGGTLLFTAYDGPDHDGNEATPSRGLELWRSGGTGANTSLFADIFPGATDSLPRNYATFGGFHYFSANGTNGIEPVGRELYRTNLSSVTLAADIEDTGGSDPQNLVISGPADPALGGQLFFTAATDDFGRELYVINNSTNFSALQPVRNLNNTVENSQIANLTPITVTIGNPGQPNRAIFSADANNNLGNELYTSDGTSNGTVILKEITPGPEGTIMGNFVRISPGLVVFTVQALDNTLTLWRTDGTGNGTFQIEGFTDEGNSPTNFRAPALVGTNLYFMLGDDELWRTNGQDDAGTVRVHRFRTTTGDSLAQGFTRLNDGRVIFSAVAADSGREPWITDLAGNTTLLADLNVGPGDSDPQDFTPTNDGRVFFTALASSDNRELYVSDGLTATLVKEINTLEGSNPRELFWHQGKLYFSARSGAFNDDLWVSDGTGGGTQLLFAINGGAASLPANFAAVGNTLYFAASTSTSARELWKTNGTDTSTVLVRDISSGTPSSDPEELVIMPATGSASRVYFVASGSGSGQATGRELWRSDGTLAGTTVVKDIIAGIGSSIADGSPAYLTVIGNRLYFVADDGVKGRELWRSDGTSAGTVLVKDINTQTSFTGTQDADPSDFHVVNGRLFFLANDGVSGRELWVSNGSSGGTVRVRDIVAGPGDAGIQDMTVVGDVLCFTADNGVNGREVWLSDGTAAGTQILEDLLPGPASSQPNSLAGIGTTLLFSALDGVIGNEPRFAFMASKLTVELVQDPAPQVLESGVSTVSFTPPTINFGSSTSLIFRLSNTGANSVRNITTSITGPNAADFIVTKKPLAVITKGVSSELTVQFRPREGGQRNATLTILSTDSAFPQFTFTLTGLCAKDPTIDEQPISQIVKVGDSVTLSSTIASGTAPITLQWRKNNAAVAGGTTNPLYLWSAKIADAGGYSAQFRSSSSPAGIGNSNIAQLSVVEDFIPARVLPARAGSGAKLTVNAAGSNLGYAWKRSPNVNLSSPETLTSVGANTRTLTLTALAPADSQYYFCEVSGPGGMVIGGTTHVKVFQNPPVITPSQVMPIGIVGSFYEYQIQVSGDAANAPLTYTVKNLPPGLKLDARTGRISGVPTAVGIGTRDVLLGATNGITPVPQPIGSSLTIVNLPAGLEGVFHGLVTRDAEINGMAGGRIELTVTKTGSYSGKLTLGADSYSYKGNLSFGIDSDPDDNPMTNDAIAVPPFTGSVSIPRKGIAAPLVLSFTIDENTRNTLSAGQITSVNVTGPVQAGVTGWKVTTHTGRYLGLYNFGIKLSPTGGQLANPDVPHGDGYGSFTVSTKGTLGIAGMTIDGEKITCSTHVGPNGEVLLYQSLYNTARKGSVCGQLTIDTEGNVDSPTDNTLANTGAFDCTRPPATAALGTAANTRTYRAGFGLADTPSTTTPLELEAFGGPYLPPAHLLQIISGSTTADNASLTFTGGGIILASRQPNLPNLAVNLGTIRVLTPSTALTKISAVLKTGLFNGSFALADDDTTTTTPKLLNKADEIKRAVRFFGLIVPESGNHRGVGLFMLPQIPPAIGTVPVRTAPILSGKVNFDND